MTQELLKEIEMGSKKCSHKKKKNNHSLYI